MNLGERTILHSDMNCFYASVEMMLDPSLRGKPVAVCGSTENRHGIVLAKSELAKKAGVKTGMVNWEARQLCPGLIMVKPQYDQYLKYSELARNIYQRYTDQVEPYGMDECWLDVTAGTDKQSICYELHTKALDIMHGRKADATFYPVVYGLEEGDDWNDEANWYKANPSLGHTISIERVREAYKNALENPAEENVFKQLRLNMWTNATVVWIPEHIYDRGNLPIDIAALEGRDCYAGLDLSSTSDITAFVLVFPPRTEDEKYIVMPFFWLPEETLELRCRRDHVLYDVWERQGYINTTEGNVIHYGFIEQFIMDLGTHYHIKEIAYDRWNATQMVQNLEDEGFTMVPFGQGFKDMSPPSKELYKLLMEGNIIHGGNPVLKWMAQNVVMRQDPAGNIKPDKERSVEKIDGIVALIMGLDRCIRSVPTTSVYDERGILFI